jgi:hypothetical protein
MNKIISMSVWGNNPRYIIGAQRQIQLAKKYYPEWTPRIYTDNVSNFRETQDVQLIEVKEKTSGYFWRFRALFEDENNIVLVRDSDARTTVREKMAVNEWLEGDRRFHTFRDHEAHYEFPIIAGNFAFRGKLPNSLRDIMKLFEENTNYYTNDQVYLRDYVWGFVESNSMIHSMNDVGWFSETRKKLKNKFCFCGNGYTENDMPLYPNTLAAAAGFDVTSLSHEYKFDEGVLLD